MNYTIQQVAGLLNVHNNTVRNWINKGLLPATQHPITKHYTIKAEDVEAFRKRFEQERQD